MRLCVRSTFRDDINYFNALRTHRRTQTDININDKGTGDTGVEYNVELKYESTCMAMMPTIHKLAKAVRKELLAEKNAQKRGILDTARETTHLHDNHAVLRDVRP